MKKLWNKILSIFDSRLLIILLVYAVMFTILIVKILSVQVSAKVKGEEVTVAKISKLRDIKSTRGNIYDVNGKLLAYNVMSYSIVMEDSGLLTTNAAKNEMIYKLLKILERFDTDLEVSFYIEENEEGNLQFTLSDNALLRFKKNAYGLKSINNLTDEQRNATAEDLFNYLKNDPLRFRISDDYSLEDTLKIMAVRYVIISNTVGTQFTIASGISEELAVAIIENGAELPGVEVKQVTSRVYNYSEYMAHIIGYTGAVNTEEIESMNESLIEKYGLSDEDIKGELGTSVLYNASDVIGKNGIEKSQELILAGKKGTSRLTVNSSGKILSQTVNTDPLTGDDIYLTIDADLQKACYYILERNLAAILLSKMTPNLDYGEKGTNASKIKIPIYEVYFALFDNEIIDIDHFTKEDAGSTEYKTQFTYDSYTSNLIEQIRNILDFNSTIVNSAATEEQQSYLNFIFEKAMSSGILKKNSIDTGDSIYKGYYGNTVTMSEFFKYALTKNWIDTSYFSNVNDYYSLSELYSLFIDKLISVVQNDNAFKEKIYRTLIFENKLSGKDICLLLFEQNVIKYDQVSINQLNAGYLTPYVFIREKIQSLEITPAMLGLTPCSGSIVITDVNTGLVKALATYPSYDNNMLANRIDYDYYTSLLNLNSLPLINRPAMQATTTGSTFKPLSSLIGLAEGVINTSTKIYDKGQFEDVVPSPRCWIYPWSHGSINVTEAIKFSCNYFYFEMGYRMMKNSDGTYSDATGMAKIRKYATMFGLGNRTGIEISESTPQISNSDAVRTSIGYGHLFSPVQISRYITAIANKGTVYNYTLIDSIKKNDGTLVKKNEPEVYNDVGSLWSNEQWRAVQTGMWQVINTDVDGFDTIYKNLGIEVAGKTGTAQVSNSSPSHVLFVSFAPYDKPEISVTVVIPNGFTSANAAYIAREVYGLYFNNENKDMLLSGNVTAGTAIDINVSD